jgi:ribosomal protein L37AE/L43A
MRKGETTMSDKMLCEECNGDFDKLYTTNKMKDRDGTCHWVCKDCFLDLEGKAFDEYWTKEVTGDC